MDVPWVNHAWHATLYVTPRGLTTGSVHEPSGCVSLTLDLVDYRLMAKADGGARESFAFEAMSVADFYGPSRTPVEAVGGMIDINCIPSEVADAVPFSDDMDRRPYDAGAVACYHGALLRIVPVFETFRTRFIGKVSPLRWIHKRSENAKIILKKTS